MSSPIPSISSEPTHPPPTQPDTSKIEAYINPILAFFPSATPSDNYEWDLHAPTTQLSDTVNPASDTENQQATEAFTQGKLGIWVDPRKDDAFTLQPGINRLSVCDMYLYGADAPRPIRQVKGEVTLLTPGSSMDPGTTAQLRITLDEAPPNSDKSLSTVIHLDASSIDWEASRVEEASDGRSIDWPGRLHGSIVAPPGIDPSQVSKLADKITSTDWKPFTLPQRYPDPPSPDSSIAPSDGQDTSLRGSSSVSLVTDITVRGDAG
jgi:hypothetical protein